MTNPDTPKLDPVLHQPVRTRIAAYLSARGETAFSELKQALHVTDGNLEAHMKKLVAGGYVTTRRLEGDGRPQTLYQLSPGGREALQEYIAALQDVLDMGSGG